MSDVFIPSLQTLAKFASATVNGKRSIVREVKELKRQSQQEDSPRHRPAFYEPWLSALFTYIKDGCRGSALEQVAEAADRYHAASFRENSAGAAKTLASTQPTGGKRGPRLTLEDESGLPLLLLNSMITLKFRDGRVMWTYAHMLAGRLSSEAFQLVRSALKIAVARDSSLIPPSAAVWAVRQADLDEIDEVMPSTRDFKVVTNSVYEFRDAWNSTPE